MTKIQFPIKKRKVTKVGTSHWFHIPSVYVKNGLINPKKKYDIVCKEVKE